MPDDAPVLKPVSVTETSNSTGSTTSTIVTSASPGARSSEFVLSVGSFLLGAGMIVYGMLKGNDSMVMFGGSISGISTSGYSIARGLAKRPA